MRVHSLARSYNVLSKDIIDIANMTGSNLKSASSRIEIDENNRIYWHAVGTFVQARRDSKGKRRL